MDKELLIKTATSALVADSDHQWVWWHSDPAHIARIVIDSISLFIQKLEGRLDEAVLRYIKASTPGIDMVKVSQQMKEKK